MLELAVFFQNAQLHFQVFKLRFQTVQLGHQATAVSISGDRCIAYLLRLNSILCNDVLGDTCHLHITTVDSITKNKGGMTDVYLDLHITTVDSITDKPVFLNLLSDNFDLCPRHINHTTLILSDTAFDLLGFIKPAQRSASGKLRSRIMFLLFGKHKFQVYLVVGMVLNKHSEICTLCKEVLKVFALLDYLIYGIFQLCFPR